MTPELERLLPDPDLQKIVELFGGYHKITSAAWAAYDKQIEATHAWLADHHKRNRKA
jgi:hypothetical protein